MKQRSHAYAEPAFDDSDLTGLGPEQGGAIVRIPGLVRVGDDSFRLFGVKERNIDFRALALAIGEPDDGTVDERLMASISRAIRREDVIRILADRMM